VPDRTEHPSREKLAAFVHGQLSDEELRSLETHVAQCETCCDQLRKVPHDDFVERLRDSTLRMSNPDAEVTDPGADAFSQLADHPRYQIVRELGKGGMGVVYLAQHRVMGRSVALKVINRRLLRNQMAVERFRQEVQAAARLSHRNIVTAFDAEQAGDLHFLVMEYVDGTDLATTVSRRGPLPVLYACNYIMQAANGLQHAHERGMVHRDIKPQNLMRAKGTIKILDFGLARLASPTESEAPAGLTLEGVTLGTPDYIAPEQARDARRADIRSDIYSLGCTLYYLLAGTVPFPTGSAVEKVVAHCTDEPVPILQLRSDLPAELVGVLSRMMAKDPAARYQTPAEVAAALRPFGQASAAGVTTPAPLTTEVSRPPAAKTRFDATSAATDEDQDDDEFQITDSDPSVSISLDLTSPGRKAIPWKSLRGPVAGGALAVVVLGLFLILNPPRGKTNGPEQGSQTKGDGAAKLPVATTQPWVDLVAKIDPVQDAERGIWRRAGSELTVEAGEFALLAVHYSPPAEYDFEVEFTRHTGSLSIALVFPAGSGQATFELDAWGNNSAGLQLIDKKDLRAQQNVFQEALINGRRYVARVEVRKGKVTALLDDRKIATYQGDGSNLEALKMWEPRDARFGLGAYQAETTFHRARIRPVK
jgi:serine/threonine protein kinase